MNEPTCLPSVFPAFAYVRCRMTHTQAYMNSSAWHVLWPGCFGCHRQGTAVPQSFSHRKSATKFPWISGFWHLGQNEVSLENFCCTFCRETGLHGNFGVRMNLGRHRTALQDFPSKLYFCGHKTPFRLHKSDLPNATASERFHRCFALRNKVW